MKMVSSDPVTLSAMLWESLTSFMTSYLKSTGKLSMKEGKQVDREDCDAYDDVDSRQDNFNAAAAAAAA